MTSVFIHNFGCRVNQAEAFAWSEQLAASGFFVEKDWRRSEIIVINSCALTSRAEADVRQFIRRLYREAPEVRLIVTGCLTEKSKELVKSFPNVFSVIPNSAKPRLVEEIKRLTGNKGEKIENSRYRSRALIKIQDGCNAHCTFCIIPSLRGQSKSVPQDEVIKQVEEAVARGYKEIVLAGIHLNSYGLDFNQPGSFLELLKKLVRISGLHYLRLSSLDPRLIPAELLDFLISEEKICPHFHLSLQHASPAVLKKMGRKSTPEEYSWILNYLRKGRPEASLGADILVGFPEEGEADYELLRNFLTSSPLTYFHVFSYSPREGTPAANWLQVKEKIKKQRAEELRQLSRQKNQEFKKKFIGQILPAIVIKRKGAQLELLTTNYFKVLIDNRVVATPGQLVKVRINEVSPQIVKGEIV